MLSDWKVLGNRLLLRPVEQDSSQGGIIRPETADDEYEILTQECEVLARGPLVSIPYNVGDRLIVLMNWAKVEIDGEILVVVDADDDALLLKETV